MESYGDQFCLTLITNDPVLAARADRAGVNLIGVDLERIGKHGRQGHIADARISDHELADLGLLARTVRNGGLFARLNPVNGASPREIDAAIAGGAVTLMLPFFATADEVDRFVRHVDGRARIVLLLETAAAVVRLRDILAVPGFDEVMVGLNDLHLALKLASHFELLASDLMAWISDTVRASGRRFGFGGVARADDNHLPVPSDLVLAQHPRLGSTSAWVSRSFLGPDASVIDMTAEIAAVRRRLDFWNACRPEDRAERLETLRTLIRQGL
jgi:hypothetical protein